MNIWYISSLIIIGLGVVILVVCLLGSIFAIRKISGVLNSTLQRIQLQQVQPMRTQLNSLKASVNRLILDIELKKSDVMEVTESFKDVVRNLTQLSTSSRMSTKQLVEKVNNDPQIQAQTEHWIKITLGYLKRNA